MKIRLLLLFLFTSLLVSAQKKSGFVSGTVLDEEGQRLTGVSIAILASQTGIRSNDSGVFRLRVPAEKAFALIFTSTGFKTYQQNFLLASGEEENITVVLERDSKRLDEVVVTDGRDRTEAGLIRINPKSVANLPAPVTGVESLIKIFVGSNNELTSQYAVRGGNYDENLIYVNDFEIYRPYLVRSGQQEGLSFINPELVRNIAFYNGGFQARYGDKMSSVLDVQYNKPRDFGGSAYVGLLEQGLHLEGAKGKFSYLLGARNRSNRNLLASQETQGIYVPASSDLQGLFAYRFNNKWSAELLANISRTQFSLQPQFSQLTSSVFSPFFTANIGIDIYFEGQERDQYSTSMVGVSTTYQPRKNLQLKFLASRFENDETENRDVTGNYLFGDRDFDRSKPTFGAIVNPLGAGLFQNWSRNTLNITDWSAQHKGVYSLRRSNLLWGLGYNRTAINDVLNEFERRDSAGYTLPYNPSQLAITTVLRSSADLQINKFNGYVQNNWLLSDSARAFTVQSGVRFQYNDLNNELLIAPRIGASFKPSRGADVVFRAAAGAYHQPPFYRELRRYNGSVNTQVLAQRSWQGVAGADYNFRYGNRPMRFSVEGYYKWMTNVVPYDIDNVRIRYFGENNAKAYAAGLEARLFGELVKDAESWISIGLMRTRENITGDRFMQYKVDSLNNPVDSMQVEGGWLRRPTDRLITVGAFIQDYLSTNKNFKVYLNALYGSNLPYNIPGSVKYRNALRIEPYIRVDIGFSALLLDADKTARRSRSPFRNFDNIWASVEVFNLIDRPNTISYLLVKDFANNTFTLPNRLTPRLLNFKIMARW